MKRPIEEVEREHWAAIGTLTPEQVKAVRRLMTASSMMQLTRDGSITRLKNLLEAEAAGEPWQLLELRALAGEPWQLLELRALIDV